MLTSVVMLAEEAGRAIMEVYRSGDTGVTYKDDNSPLTRADTAANSVIIEGLSGLTPDVPILSEESKEVRYEERKEWNMFWLVDPLDGTKEFINRNDEFTVNIALIEDGISVLGVVCAPALGVTYFAADGEGAYKSTLSGLSEPEEIRVAPYVDGTLKVVASRSHKGEAVEKFLKQIKDSECVSKGSSLKFCLVAEGSAHLYPRFGPTMEWDTAAAQCVVECAGGTVTDLSGDPLRYNKHELLNPYFVVSTEPGFPWQDHMVESFIK